MKKYYIVRNWLEGYNLACFESKEEAKLFIENDFIHAEYLSIDEETNCIPEKPKLIEFLGTLQECKIYFNALDFDEKEWHIQRPSHYYNKIGCFFSEHRSIEEKIAGKYPFVCVVSPKVGETIKDVKKRVRETVIKAFKSKG